MAKGTLVTDADEALIVWVYREHPKWKAPEVRNEVSHLLREKNQKLLLKNRRQLLPNWPSLSTVQKVLAPYRKIIKESPTYPEDEPWSMSTLDKYPIPHEAMPKLVEVWKSRTREGHTLTIREAKWVARLSPFLKEELSLIAKAITYARLEQIYQLAGRPFNSAKLDQVYVAGMKVEFNDVSEAILYMKVMFESVKRTKFSTKKGVTQNEGSHMQEG